MPRFEPLALPGVVLVTPDVHGDARGFFLERWKASAYLAHGIGRFVQHNHSRSRRGVLRGLHWQVPPHAQGKLVSVPRGRIFDVAVDLRRGSPTFGRWTGAVLDDDDHRQLWIPAGFAHGFVVRSEVADVAYASTAEYAPAAERGLAWDDPEVGVDWAPEGDRPGSADDGSVTPELSERDRHRPRLADLGPDDLFEWEDPT